MDHVYERPLPPLPASTPRQDFIGLPYDEESSEVDNAGTYLPPNGSQFMDMQRPGSSAFADPFYPADMTDSQLSDSRFNTVKANDASGSSLAYSGLTEDTYLEAAVDDDRGHLSHEANFSSSRHMQGASPAEEGQTEEWRVNVFEDLVRYQRSNRLERSEAAVQSERRPSEPLIQGDRRPSESLLPTSRPPSGNRSFSNSLGSRDAHLASSVRSAVVESLPDPSTFPMPTGSLPSSGSVSPAASRHGHLHYSSDMSASTRASVSTRASTWTEKSSATSATSPGAGRSSLMSDASPNDKEISPIEDGYGGIEITSHAEYASGPRRSRTVTANSSRDGSLSGHTQHHRPTWSREASLDHHPVSEDPSLEFPSSSALPSPATVSSPLPFDFIPPRVTSRSRATSEASRRGKGSIPASISIPSSNRLRHADSYSDLMSRSEVVTSPPRTSSLRRTGRKHSASVSSRSTTSSPVSRAPLTSDSHARSESTSTSSGSSVARASSTSTRQMTALGIDTKAAVMGSHSLRTRVQPTYAGDHRSDNSAPQIEAVCRLSSASTDASSDRDSFSHFGFVDAYIDSPDDANGPEEEPNALRVLDEGLGQVVEANGRPFEEVEPEIGAHATHLILSGCSSERLIPVLQNILPRLAETLLVLDISACGLVFLPAAISACTALEELNFSSNPLSTPVLPHMLGDLPALRVLVADDVGARSLPTSLANLSDLQTLSIRRNKFTHLPSWIHRWAKLERLCIDGNPWEGPYAKTLGPILGGQSREWTTSSSTGGADHLQLPRPRLAQTSSAPHSTFGEVSTPLVASLPPQMHSTDSEELSLASDSILAKPSRPFLRRIQSGNQILTSGHTSAVSPSPLSYYDSASLTQDGFAGIGQSMTAPASPMVSSSADEELSSDAPSPHLRSEADEWGVVPENVSRRSGPDSASKWNFLRKMGRKSSSQRLFPDLDSSASGSPSRSGNANEIGSVRPGEAPNLSHFAKPSSTLPPVDGSRMHTRNAGKRQSFLPVPIHAAVSADDGAGGFDSTLAQLCLEDAEAHKRRLRALLHYFRDLDDLSSSIPGPITPSTPESISPNIRKEPSFGTAVRTGRTVSSSVGVAAEASIVSDSDTRDVPNRRKRILLEMVSSEESYLKGLAELVDIYVRPAMQPLEPGSSATLPAVEHRAVFSNVEGLYQFHRDAFLPSLRAAVQPLLDQEAQRGPTIENDGFDEADAVLTAHVAEDVALVFSRHAAFFAMYSSYVNNCDNAQLHVQAWLAPTSSATSKSTTISVATGAAVLAAMAAGAGAGAASSSANSAQCAIAAMTSSHRKKLKGFMKRCRADPRHSQLNVESYLLLPVQRLPRYRLLLEDLVRHTPSSRLRNQETPATTAALGYIARICSLVNESKRQSEQDRKLLAWQARIKRRWPSPLVQPHRRLVKDGTLILSRVVKCVPAFVAEYSASDAATTLASSLAFGPPAGGVAVNSLQQSSLNLPLILILCNDITVAVADTSNGRDDNAPVELYTVLRQQVGKPVQVVGGTNIRIVDTRSIYYFTARSAQEADAWCEALNAHSPSE